MNYAAPPRALRAIHRIVYPARLAALAVGVVVLATWKFVELLPL